MTTPTIHEVMLETRQQRMTAMAPDPLEEIQRAIDQHAANRWMTQKYQSTRAAWDETAAALEAEKAAILAEL